MWLIESLLPKESGFKGCEVVFPETVFFENKRPKMIVKMDKEFCLTSIRNPKKISLPNIYKEFTDIFDERKKDHNGVFSAMYHRAFTLHAIEHLHKE